MLGKFKLLFVSLVLACCVWTPVTALANEAQSNLPPETGATVINVNGQVNQQISALDMRQIEDFVHQIEKEFGQYLPGMDFNELVQKVAKGEVNLNVLDLLNNLLQYIFRELLANSKLLMQLIVLAIIGAVLQNLQSAFEKGTTGKVAYAVVFLSLMILAIQSFSLAVNIGRGAVDDMVTFMQLMLPILLTLLAAMGGLASAAIFHPVMLLILGVVGTLVKNVIFPLIFFAAVLNIISNFSKDFQVSKLADLLKDAGMWLMGLAMTVFLGIMAIQGVAGSVADGVALRTAKFAAGAFIPVVGKMFADSVEAVVGGSIMLKNAVGLVGLVVVFILCAFPALKILTMVFVYRIAAALIQPVAQGQITNCLSTMGKSLTSVFAAVAVVGLMCFFAIAIMVGAGNMTVMLR